MKEYDKNDQAVRWALYQSYNERDFYNEREPIFYDSLEIDHLIPESMVENSKKLKELIVELGLPNDFNVNNIINLVPTTRKYNSLKGSNLFSSNALRFYFEQTMKKSNHIEKLIKSFSHKKGIEKIICQLLPYSDDEPGLINIIDETLTSKSFENTEFVSEKYVLKSTKNVYLNGFLPYDEKLSGSCLILFHKLKNRDSLISFSEPYITDVLFSGVGKKYNSKERKYVLFPGDNDDYYIQLGNIRLLMSHVELKDLSNLLDFYSKHYTKKVINLKNVYGINNFEMSAKSPGTYKLFKMSKLLWMRLLEFTDQYHHDSGDTEFHVFDYGSDVIKVVSRPEDSRFSTPFHAYIIPEQEEHRFYPYSLNSDNEVWVCWKLVQLGFEEKIGFKDVWTAEDTFIFFTKKIIPKLIYNIDNRGRLFKPKYKKFLSGFQIENYISVKNYSAMMTLLGK